MLSKKIEAITDPVERFVAQIKALDGISTRVSAALDIEIGPLRRALCNPERSEELRKPSIVILGNLWYDVNVNETEHCSIIRKREYVQYEAV
jgi:hypothetical protein